MEYRTPGVYVQEVSLLPPSVAAVATAIPAFIGYTADVIDDDGNTVEDNDLPYVKRIGSLLDYEEQFGKAKSQAITVSIAADNSITIEEIVSSKYRMYYALQLYFANGGGPCYLISVGKYAEVESVTSDDLVGTGLEALKKIDEPTLIIFPDLAGIVEDEDDADQVTAYHDVYKAALAQCEKLGDRFTICDLLNGAADNIEASAAAFRDGIGTQALRYGAAYYPDLQTTLTYQYDSASVTFQTDPETNFLHNKSMEVLDAALAVNQQFQIATKNNTTVAAAADDADLEASRATALRVANAAIAAANTVIAIIADDFDSTPADNALIEVGEAVDMDALQTASANALVAATTARDAIGTADDMTTVEETYTDQLKNEIRNAIASQRVVMPPSSAIAGVYATVDRLRGVWKAPANVSLSGVSRPAVKISHQEQADLNVNSTGKSINAIRAFTGKGNLVWGARTLAGNDNEWRYISVRRFFNMVEESTKKATEAFVFEPNDANTWNKVRAMIENFLLLQWRAGALAGSTPEKAYYVRVGLGQTMTNLDILEGRMIVEIGMAVVRPAEFIVLRFSHFIQGV